METLLRTENLTKKFKNQVAIQNISMNVPENSVYGLLGPNGAGKSTTLKMIAGILKPTKGSIIFNKHPWKRSDLSNIGALIETPPLYGNLTARENLKVRTELLNISDGRIDEVVKAVERAVREREFLGGVGAGHQVSREPGFLHGAVDVGLTAGSVEGQVLVALVGDVDDKADVAPVVLELLGDGDGAQIVIGDGDGGGDFGALDVVVFDGLIDLLFLFGSLAILLHRAGQILVGLGKDEVAVILFEDEFAVLELHVVRLIFGGDRYGGGVLCLPFKVDNLKEQVEGACTVLIENQDAVDTPILEHLHVLIGQLFAIHGSTRELPAADEVGLGVFGAAAAARQGKGERQDACQECEHGLFERCLHGVLLNRTKPIEAGAGAADPPPITR